MLSYSAQWSKSIIRGWQNLFWLLHFSKFLSTFIHFKNRKSRLFRIWPVLVPLRAPWKIAFWQFLLKLIDLWSKIPKFWWLFMRLYAKVRQKDTYIDEYVYNVYNISKNYLLEFVGTFLFFASKVLLNWILEMYEYLTQPFLKIFWKSNFWELGKT